MNLAQLFRRKPLAALHHEHGDHPHALKRVLGPWTLTAIGVGCTIGSGIFVMTGAEAALHAGPAIVLSFVLAAVASALAALSYCELAAMIPVAGSAYSYAYASLGELAAWFIGWELLLEYGLANAAVASGWSGNLENVLEGFHLGLPAVLRYAPGQAIPGTHAVGLFNLPAAISIFAVTVLLLLGIRESARTNAAIVAVKIAILGLFVALCVPAIQPALLHPLMPMGWKGVMAGAGAVFFLFIGFDAVSTVAEEAKNPQRDLPLGILGGLGLVTALYVAVAGVLVAVVPYPRLNVDAPLSLALTALHHPLASWVVSFVAVVGILSVLLTGSIGQTRILYVMARDGLMPRFMAQLSRNGTPVTTTVLLGVVTAALGALVPLDTLADLVSIGTLAAFIVVAVGVVVLRYTAPDARRGFRCPWVPVVPIAGILINLYLMGSLSVDVWKRFVVWLVVGFALYFGWARRGATKVFEADAAKLAAPVTAGPS